MERIGAYVFDVEKNLEIIMVGGDNAQLSGDLEIVKKEELRLRGVKENLANDVRNLIDQINARREEIQSIMSQRIDVQDGQAGMTREQIKIYVQERLTQYKLLMEENLRLVTELNAYHLLLRSEEHRLHIHDVVPEEHTGRSIETRGHSDTDVVIDEVNLQGNYIHLTNKGKHDFYVNGWTLEVANAKGQVVKYTFRSNEVIQIGKPFTVWAPNRGGPKVGSAENHLADVTWPAGDRITARLLDQSGKQKAILTANYSEETHHLLH
jgi:hypothetical protein